MQGSMKTESRIVRVGCALLAWLAVAGTAPLAAGAQSGPLLSGYGAPGQGNQVILGSALLGGPSGGGSSGSGGARQSTGPGRPSFAGGSGTAAAIGRTTSPAHAGKGALARGPGRSGAAPGGHAPASYPVV